MACEGIHQIASIGSLLSVLELRLQLTESSRILLTLPYFPSSLPIGSQVISFARTYNVRMLVFICIYEGHGIP